MMFMDESMENKFFSEALQFFYEHRWLYDTPVTEILIRGSLDAFPEKWLDFLRQLDNEELNEFVVRKTTKPEWPISLQKFTEKCKALNILTSICPSRGLHLPPNFRIGLTPKKQHEIVHFAHLIHEQCVRQGVKLIVDLGSGLGYVCQYLHHLYGYRVLGLEEKQENVNKACGRQKRLYPKSINHVKYATCRLTSDSTEQIESIILREFQDVENICLIGLHTCGDLGIYASRIFCNMRIAQLIILISCCYHRLSISESIQANSKAKQYFHYFPVSRSAQNAIHELNYDIGDFLRQPFLRLACQEPAEWWNNMSASQHAEHSFHVLARAVLELYAQQKHCSLKKLVQKGTRKSQCKSFETYVEDTILRYSLQPTIAKKVKAAGEPCEDRIIKKEITALWIQHSHKLETVEIYTALQLLLQAPAESLILKDRLCWFHENGLKAEMIPVMDKTASPRCNAIVSWKEAKSGAK